MAVVIIYGSLITFEVGHEKHLAAFRWAIWMAHLLLCIICNLTFHSERKHWPSFAERPFAMKYGIATVRKALWLAEGR